MALDDNSEIEEELGFWGGFTELGFSPKASIISSIFTITFLILKFSYLFVIKPKQWKVNSEVDIKLLVVYLTKNQEKAANNWILYKENYYSISNFYDSNFKIPWGRFAFYGLKNTFKAFISIVKSGKFKNYMPWLEEFARYYAGKEIAKEMFARLKPSFILISNDHSGVSRGINRIARQNGIKIIYTQHACIGKGFPRLNFDLSMLDGVQAFEQYFESGEMSGKVIITGRQKKQFHNKSNIYKNKIGLATNSLDDLNSWEEIIKSLLRNNYNIVLRCHPAEKRLKKWKKIAFENNIEFDHGELTDFLGGVDVLVAGLTGTVLDAYMMGVPTVYFEDPKSKLISNLDYYNYEKYGICVLCESPDSINQCIYSAIERGINLKSALMYDAGVQCDPSAVKNTVLKNFLENEQ